MSRFRTVVNIADTVIAVYSECPSRWTPSEASLKAFLSSEEPQISVFVRDSGLPQLDCCRESKIFDSGTHWRLHKSSLGTVLVLGPASEPPSRIVIINRKFQKIDVFIDPGTPLPTAQNFLVEWPIGQVLMVCLLAQGGGLMAHACGIDHQGKGYLFMGNSGHGKSTMAELWGGHGIILNDDRIVVRYKKGRFWIFGTPWHGDYSQVSPRGVPLDKVFFLHRSNHDSVIPVASFPAISMILTRSFPPLWDKKAMSFTLDFVARLADAVPCFNLGFVPDVGVLNFVQCLK